MVCEEERPCFYLMLGILGDYIKDTDSWEVTLVDSAALKRGTIVVSEACKSGPIVVKRKGLVFIDENNPSAKEAFNCGICHEQVCYDDSITINCWHQFHGKCFKTWAKQELDCPSEKLDKMHDSNTNVQISCPTCCRLTNFRLERPSCR